MGKAIVTLIVAFVAGCSSSSSPAPAPTCTPGATQSCACGGGATGVQSCNAEGSGFGTCGGCSGSDAGGDTACATENGAVACDRVDTAWCVRLVQCCKPTGTSCDSRCHNLVSGSSTDYNACSQDACKAYLTRIGYDCATTAYTSKNVCASVTQRCVDDLPLEACSDMLGGTANTPVSCKTWGAQFF